MGGRGYEDAVDAGRGERRGDEGEAWSLARFADQNREERAMRDVGVEQAAVMERDTHGLAAWPSEMSYLHSYR